jgi:hypothetical protein
MWDRSRPWCWLGVLAPTLLSLSLGTTARGWEGAAADVGDPFSYAPGKSEVVKAWLANNGWEFTFDNTAEHVIYAKKTNRAAITGDPFLYAPGKSEVVKAWLAANGWQVTFDNTAEHVIYATKTNQAAITVDRSQTQCPTMPQMTAGPCGRCGKSGDYLYFCSPPLQSCVIGGVSVRACRARVPVISAPTYAWTPGAVIVVGWPSCWLGSP